MKAIVEQLKMNSDQIAYMWKLRATYGTKGLDGRCPMCQSEEDTTEHILECNKGDK